MPAPTPAERDQAALQAWARHWPFTRATPALVARVERARRAARRQPASNTPAPW